MQTHAWEWRPLRNPTGHRHMVGRLFPGLERGHPGGSRVLVVVDTRGETACQKLKFQRPGCVRDGSAGVKIVYPAGTAGASTQAPGGNPTQYSVRT